MTSALFIVNPRAGRGRGKRVGEEVSRKLVRDNYHHHLVYTKEPAEARALASGTDAKVVVAIGGDGTINEVVNGIAGSTKKLGVVPAGSGNDAIKSLNIPRKIDEALGVVRSESSRTVDTAIVECSMEETGGKQHGRRFLNGVGIGFDASVAGKVASIRRLRGTFLYLTAVLQTLREYNTPDVQIKFDEQELSGDKLLVAVGNGVCAGGGFYLTPNAVMDDGLLDLCAIPSLTVSGILGIIPRVLRGTHVARKGVVYLQGRSLSVSSSKGFAVHADGEVLTQRTHHVSVRIVPRSLDVLVPRKAKPERLN